jgi:malate dehydrogenase
MDAGARRGVGFRLEFYLNWEGFHDDMRHKIAVIGVGNVGATTALFLTEKNLGDIVLTDIVKHMPQGKALDIFHAAPLHTYDGHIKGTNDLADIAGADLVIVTAGLARKPGMNRNDLLKANAKIVGECSEKIRQYAPDAVVIVVSNPLDVMCWVALKTTGFPSNRVVGMAGVLDSSRLRGFIAEALGVHPSDVSALVLGGHGDSMAPMIGATTVGGIPVSELLSPEKLAAIVEHTRKAGSEIVELLTTGSAYYSPAAATVEMAEAILLDSKRILPCAAFLSGQYGVSDCYLGVPVLLGSGGVEKIYEMKLNDVEKESLQKSVKDIKESMLALEAMTSWRRVQAKRA